jgi:hypothetical protein
MRIMKVKRKEEIRMEREQQQQQRNETVARCSDEMS